MERNPRAAEIGIGDEITGLASIPGNESTSSMAVAGKNSMHILYGSTTDTFSMIPLSQEAGAAAYSLQQLTAPVGYDAQGFRVFRPTQAFGNFAWDISSKLVDKIVRERTPVCSVFSSRYSRYRCFFSDGSAMSGTPEGKGIAWSQINYGITFSVAHAGELDGVERVFYGGDDGFVYEADVGRSFDGQAIQAAITLPSSRWAPTCSTSGSATWRSSCQARARSPCMPALSLMATTRTMTWSASRL